MDVNTRLKLLSLMAEKHSKFEGFIIRSILVNNEFNIAEVCQLESLKSMYLDREKYPEILRMLKMNNIAEVMNLPAGNESFEYLIIMRFEDQYQKRYYVTVYDNSEIYQDAQVIDLVKID